MVGIVRVFTTRGPIFRNSPSGSLPDQRRCDPQVAVAAGYGSMGETSEITSPLRRFSRRCAPGAERLSYLVLAGHPYGDKSRYRWSKRRSRVVGQSNSGISSPDGSVVFTYLATSIGTVDRDLDDQARRGQVGVFLRDEPFGWSTRRFNQRGAPQSHLCALLKCDPVGARKGGRGHSTPRANRRMPQTSFGANRRRTATRSLSERLFQQQ